jgi:DNA repair protein SbcC/Rad50
MIIKKVILKNIRSYLDEEIVFPEGKILLSGDIGSGKSSILLAIEFALFGTLRGELSGSALLRNGSKFGSVGLEITVEGSFFFIHRGLKRNKNSVEQDNGYVIFNGFRKDLTPIELRSYVLDLLNYPKEFLTKSKNLIYRYTIYTPQEEMKRILLEDPEVRTGFLRKIFNIDKYEIVKSNSSSYTKFLREKQRAFEALTKDFDEKKKSLDEKKAELKKSEDSLLFVVSESEKLKGLLSEKEGFLKAKEKEVNEMAEIFRIFSQNNAVLEQKENQMNFFENSLKEIEDSLLEEFEKTEDKSKEIEIIEKELSVLECFLNEVSGDSAGLRRLYEESEKILVKIKDLDKCPLCLQKVEKFHKDNIKKDEEEKIFSFKSKEVENKKKIAVFEDKIKKFKEELKLLRSLQQKHLLCEHKRKSRESVVKKKDSYVLSLKSLMKEIDSIKKQQDAYKNAIEKNSCEKEFKVIKEEFDLLKKKFQDFLIEKSRLDERIFQLNKYISLIERDINSKLEAKKNLENSRMLHNWFVDYFVPLVDVIEKNVMAKINYDFNDIFQKWFSLLVDDELIYASLDDSFSPFIQQNGFDIEYENLSGGERTACALAYRLALNKIVNDVFVMVKTKDILILDEPTDGFSDEQLEKIGNVLDELKLKQIIIVSHESKIENFVDTVIRIEKENHVSKVFS